MKIMTDYNHVLIVSPNTADNLSEDIIKNAGSFGAAVVVNDENGLQALSEGFKSEDMERLQNVLPNNMSTAKANGVLHKLNFRLGKSAASRAVRTKDNARNY